MTQTQTFEFCKLDSIDLRVASWLYFKCPHSLPSYLEFIAEHDYQRRGVKLNAPKVYEELLEVHDNSTCSLIIFSTYPL